jgi:hypothetical protein
MEIIKIRKSDLQRDSTIEEKERIEYMGEANRRKDVIIYVGWGCSGKNAWFVEWRSPVFQA